MIKNECLVYYKSSIYQMETCKQCKYNTKYNIPFFNGYCRDCHEKLSDDLMSLLTNNSQVHLVKMFIDKYNIKVTSEHYLSYSKHIVSHIKYDRKGFILLDSLLSQNNCLDAHFFEELSKISYSFGKKQFYDYVPYGHYTHASNLLPKWISNKCKISDISHNLPKRVLKPSLELIPIIASMINIDIDLICETSPLIRYIFNQSILDLTICFYNIMAWPPYVLLEIFKWLPLIDKMSEHMVIGYIMRVRDSLKKLCLIHY